MKFYFNILLFVLVVSSVFAQQKINGFVGDSESGLGLADVEIVLDGVLVANSSVTGEYFVEVALGSHSIEIKKEGFETISEEVTIEEGFELFHEMEKPIEVATLPVVAPIVAETDSLPIVDTVKTAIVTSPVLNQEAQEGETRVSLRARGGQNGSEAALTRERKNAVQQKTNIGAEELAQKDVGDAQEAVAKTAGVTKQVGVKNVFVRGLGDRYNATTLNGFPLPSDDPEYKNISLDIFSTDIISSLDIDKTFGANLYGDVAGANIDIKSKEYDKRKWFVDLSLSTGFNTEALSQDFLRIEGSNFFGTVEDRTSIGVDNTSVYDFDRAIQPEQQSLQQNNSYSFKIGNSFKLNKGKLNALFVGDISSSYRFLEGINRRVNATGDAGQNLNYQESVYSASQLAFLNLFYRRSRGFSLIFNTGVIHTNNQEVGEYLGQANSINDDPSTGDVFILRQQENDNILNINQLISEIKLNKRLSLELGAAYNYETSAEPDTKTNSFAENGLGTNDFLVATTSPGNQQRLGIQLRANDLNARFKLEKQLGKNKNNKLKLGYNYRNYDEDFEYFIFRQLLNNNVSVDFNNIDEVFVPSNINQLIAIGGFQIPDNDPGFYNANKTIHSGFADLQYEFDAFTLDLGVRLDNINQTVDYNFEQAQGGAENIGSSLPIEETFILPSFAAKYNFSRNSIARLSGSKTYILPRFKEVAPFLYQTVAFTSFGRDLTFSDVYNLDARYEYYFSKDELISLTGYYKYIQNPINRIGGIQAAGSLSYANLKDAVVYGAELEFKKKIMDFSNDKLRFGFVLSYLFSEQTNELSEDNLAGINPSFTNATSELEGASPLTVNTDLRYSHEFNNKSEFSLSSLLNYNAEKIFALGTQTLNDITQNEIFTLDFVAKYKLEEHWTFKLSFKNVLNPTYRLQQEATDDGEVVDVLTFKNGMIVNGGFSYKF